MKITHNKVGQNLNVSDTAKADKSAKVAAAKPESTNKADALADLGATKVNVSTRAQDLKKIKEAALATPDVNEAKVARLQKLIDEGKYKVDAKDVADRMVDDHLNWE